MLNGVGGGEGGVGVGIPTQAKASGQETNVPAKNVKTNEAEMAKLVHDIADDLKATGKEKGQPADEQSPNAETPMTEKDSKEVVDAVDQAIDNSIIFPEGCRIVIEDIFSKGDKAKNLQLHGKDMREKAQSAPTEGEGEGDGVLSIEQKNEQIALGCDIEIEGLQRELNQTKNKIEQKKILEKIDSITKEKNKTGIETNQLNSLAKFLKVNKDVGEVIDRHIKNGTPTKGIEKVIELAVVDKEVRKSLCVKLQEIGYSEDQVKLFNKKFADQAKIKNVEKGAKIVTIGTLLTMLLTMWSGLKKEKQGMG